MEIAVTVIGTVLLLSQGFVLRSLHQLEQRIDKRFDRVETKLDGHTDQIAALDKALAVHVEA